MKQVFEQNDEVFAFDVFYPDTDQPCPGIIWETPETNVSVASHGRYMVHWDGPIKVNDEVMKEGVERWYSPDQLTLNKRHKNPTDDVFFCPRCGADLYYEIARRRDALLFETPQGAVLGEWDWEEYSLEPQGVEPAFYCRNCEATLPTERAHECWFTTEELINLGMSEVLGLAS